MHPDTPAGHNTARLTLAYWQALDARSRRENRSRRYLLTRAVARAATLAGSILTTAAAVYVMVTAVALIGTP